MNTKDIAISPDGFYTLQIPSADRMLFLSLVKKMGWKASKAKAKATIPSATLNAIKEARTHKNAVRVKTDTLEDFIQSLS